MKKYIILLIIPLLFFSISCNDDDNDDLIPVSEYPESILGHWKQRQVENIITITTQTLQTDPVYGTQSSEESISTYNYLETNPQLKNFYNSQGVSEDGIYYTFKYDGTIDRVVNLFNVPNSVLTQFPVSHIGTYQITEDIIDITYEGQIINGFIQDFTNSSFTINEITIDTTELVNNSYSIIETSEKSFFERIEESDIPTSN
tara:strand:+ start:92 stop:697 length:606 start_codon:yes stop_codon:yes gene_type:complete